MNTLIEIYDNDLNTTGKYEIWYYDHKSERQLRSLGINETNSLLNMRQKEDFFMGKYKFHISEYDLKRALIEGDTGYLTGH